MASPENISLNDLFNLYMGLDKVVFVKNVSDDTARDTLECYLAAILKRDVIKVHYPADVNCCCIAVVHRPIRGLRKFGKDLAEQPLEGNVLEMCSLGGCAGLLIRNPPIQQSDMVALELFVKSTEFVGDEKDAVKEIKCVPCLSGRCVVVQIPDTAVVSRILNRPEHPQFHNLDLDIDPYFPNLHDLLGQQNEVEDLHVPCLQAEILEIDQTFQTHDEKYPGKDTHRCTDEDESGNKRNISTENSAKEMTLSSKLRIFLEDSDLSEKDESNKSKEVICVQKALAFEQRDIAVMKESMQGSSKVIDEQTEVPFIFNLGPDNTSNSGSEDRFDQKGTSQPFASTTADSGNENTEKIDDETQSAAGSEQFDFPPTGKLVGFESTGRPSSHGHRFRQKAKEFQHGLTQEEAFEQALAQSMSDHNISGRIQEQDRSGREEPSNSDQNAYFGTLDKQDDTLQHYSASDKGSTNVLEEREVPLFKLKRNEHCSLGSGEFNVNERKYSPSGNEFSEESSNSPMTDYFSDVASQHKSAVHEEAAPNGGWHRVPSAEQGAIPTPAGRPSRERNKLYQKAQEFQSGKSEDEALALAISMSDQDQRNLPQKRRRSGRPPFRSQRSDSAEASDRDKLTRYKTGSAGNQDAATQSISVVQQEPAPIGGWHGFPSAEQGAIPKSAGRPSKQRNTFRQKAQEFQSGKSEDEALALAISMSDQDQRDLPQNRRRSGRPSFRSQRSHSAEGKDKDRQTRYRAGSAGNQETQQDPHALENQTKLPPVKHAAKDINAHKASKSHDQNEHDKQLKGKAPYKQVLDKRENVSSGARVKIRDILKKHHVKSYEIPTAKKYRLEGDEESVKQAYTEILKTLLDDDTENEASKSNRIARRKEIKSKPDSVTEYMALTDDPAVPDYWKYFNSGSLIRNALQTVKLFTKDYIRVELDSDDPVYKAIKKLINATWDKTKIGVGNDAVGLDKLGYRRMKITKIQRIENLQLYAKYSRHRQHIFRAVHKRGKKSCCSVDKLPNTWGPVKTQDLTGCHVLHHEMFPQVNEHFFFHGTSRDNIDVICDSGMDARLGSQTAMYGAGIYGAESPSKADQYADSQDSRMKNDRKMFLLRMVLGNCYLCIDKNPHKYKRPPCAKIEHMRDDCKEKSHGIFDSVIGQYNHRLFREFVVYEKDQIYPEYLISYNRE